MHFHEFHHRLISRFGDVQYDADFIAGPEWHACAKADIARICIRRKVIKQARQGYVECDADEFHAHSVACQIHLEDTLHLLPKPMG